jgi:hypothetical protein
MVQGILEKWNLPSSTRTRIIAFLCVTWLPLLILALVEGRALTDNPRESFLLDFACYARFFIGIPLLIAAETVVGTRLTAAAKQFVDGGFIYREDRESFSAAITILARRRDSIRVESVLVVVAFAAAWWLTPDTVYQNELSSWRTPLSSSGEVLTVSYSGLWYRIVSLPILQFFLYRWFWRLFLWGQFLRSVSRLKLDMVPTHADQAGGLGFLGTSHASMGIFTFAFSAVLGAEAAFLLVYGNVEISSLQLPFLLYLALTQLLIFGPLLMFCPALIRARLAGLRSYSLLVNRYNRAFHEKWIEGRDRADEPLDPTDEPLLGSADIQSLADLTTSFDNVRSMKVVPFSMRVMIQLAVVTSLPCLPLILLVMPVAELLQLLAGALF